VPQQPTHRKIDPNSTTTFNPLITNSLNTISVIYQKVMLFICFPIHKTDTTVAMAHNH